MRTETLIFSQLLSNEQYARKVMPHLKAEYFQEQSDKVLFKLYRRYFDKHNTLPSKHAMMVETENLKGSSQEVYQAVKAAIQETQVFNESLSYLTDKTEQFCKEQAIYNALKEAVLIADGQDKTKTSESIPSILQQALSVCFDTNVGHDYINDSDSRYDYYHLSEARIPTGIKIFDMITKKGFPRKTLNVFLAPPHGGKSFVMMNLAVGAMNAGYNVLYITLEMAEYEIGKRFDVNLMDIDFDTLETITKPIFDNKFNRVKRAARGQLKIKEYPTASAHTGHIKALLQEYRQKNNFVPDLVVVDYMGIMASEKYKAGAGANSFTILKSVGEELRAFAIEEDVAVLTAVQTNRSGVGNVDIDITATSESFGIPAIADFFCAIINTEELKEMNQIQFRQLKNRYKSLDEPNRFLLGTNYARMKLLDTN